MASTPRENLRNYQGRAKRPLYIIRTYVRTYCCCAALVAPRRAIGERNVRVHFQQRCCYSFNTEIIGDVAADARPIGVIAAAAAAAAAVNTLCDQTARNRGRLRNRLLLLFCR